MKKTTICILCLFLAISVKVHGMTLYATIDTNSTEGDYYGGIYFSFSSTNSGDYEYYSYLGPGNGDRWYATVNGGVTYTDPVTGAQISVGLQASGFGNAYGELDFASIITVNDPALGTIVGGLGNGYFPSDGTDVSGGAFHVGQPTTFGYGTGDNSEYYSFEVSSNFYCSFGCSLTGYFDGTNGVAVGSWYVHYTVPEVTSAPEPAITLQLVLGGFCLWLATRIIRPKRQYP
jgi:hypothetical protein